MIVGHEVEVQLVASKPATEMNLYPVMSANTILVKGLNPQCQDESVLDFYFSNKAKCGGGDIAKITLKDTEAYITFTEPGGNSVI